MSQVTRNLERAQAGDPQAADQLLPLVYDELRQLAARKLAQLPPGQTLQPTALVHEAWLKLAGKEAATWTDRQHFFRAAAQAMRQILIDRARARKQLKRGAGSIRLRLDEVNLATETEPDTLLVVDEAIESLAQQHPERAELVKLRFYVGLSVDEAARALGITDRTVRRHWIHARAWLFREIHRSLHE